MRILASKPFISPSRILSILFIVLFVGYALFQSRYLIEGPRIAIESPPHNATVHAPFALIEGHGRNIAHISLNDRSIFIDERGNFSESLLLAPGYNIITVKAADRFGRETQEVLEIVYQP